MMLKCFFMDSLVQICVSSSLNPQPIPIFYRHLVKFPITHFATDWYDWLGSCYMFLSHQQGELLLAIQGIAKMKRSLSWLHWRQLQTPWRTHGLSYYHLDGVSLPSILLVTYKQCTGGSVVGFVAISESFHYILLTFAPSLYKPSLFFPFAAKL